MSVFKIRLSYILKYYNAFLFFLIISIYHKDKKCNINLQFLLDTRINNWRCFD